MERRSSEPCSIPTVAASAILAREAPGRAGNAMTGYGDTDHGVDGQSIGLNCPM